MVDKGDLEDLRRCLDVVKAMGLRDRVKIAFAGEVKIEQIGEMIGFDIDALDIGKEIIDAPLLDMKFNII